MLNRPLINFVRGMRVCAPSHPLLPKPSACPTPAECDLAPGEECHCGWHDSSYELRMGVEVVEGLKSADLELWFGKLCFA